MFVLTSSSPDPRMSTHDSSVFRSALEATTNLPSTPKQSDVDICGEFADMRYLAWQLTFACVIEVPVENAHPSNIGE
jgi:hypothetical protein